MSTLDAFTTAYLECALWSSVSDDGEPLEDLYGIEDLTSSALIESVRDCEAFQRDNAADLEAMGGDAEQNGHDFWLTRNGHGAGFWDRGKGEVGERLSKAAKVYGSVDLMETGDGKVTL